MHGCIKFKEFTQVNVGAYHMHGCIKFKQISVGAISYISLSLFISINFDCIRLQLLSKNNLLQILGQIINMCTQV